MKDRLFFFLCALVIVGTYLYTKKLNKEREMRCAASPQCQESRLKASSNSKTELVTAPSGTVFFRGSECISGCDSLAAGYRWAEKVGLTKEEGCEHANQEHEEGCLLYYNELLESQYDPGDAPDHP